MTLSDNKSVSQPIPHVRQEVGGEAVESKRRRPASKKKRNERRKDAVIAFGTCLVLCASKEPLTLLVKDASISLSWSFPPIPINHRQATTKAKTSFIISFSFTSPRRHPSSLAASAPATPSWCYTQTAEGVMQSSSSSGSSSSSTNSAGGTCVGGETEGGRMLLMDVLPPLTLATIVFHPRTNASISCPCQHCPLTTPSSLPSLPPSPPSHQTPLLLPSMMRLSSGSWTTAPSSRGLN